MNETIANKAPAELIDDLPDELELEDEISKRLAQAAAIVSLMALYPKQSDECPDVALPNAAWAVRDLLKQTGVLVGQLHAKAAQPAQGGNHA